MHRHRALGLHMNHRQCSVSGERLGRVHVGGTGKGGVCGGGEEALRPRRRHQRLRPSTRCRLCGCSTCVCDCEAPQAVEKPRHAYVGKSSIHPPTTQLNRHSCGCGAQLDDWLVNGGVGGGNVGGEGEAEGWRAQMSDVEGPRDRGTQL